MEATPPIIRTTAPASLLLGLARLSSGVLAWLGLTVQYPPISIDARPAPALAVTGASADLGYPHAARALQRFGLPPAEVEIDYALPRRMGLGAEPMLALSLARTLAALAHDPDAEDTFALADGLGLPRSQALAVQSFHQGGVLLVPAGEEGGPWPQPLRRCELSHDDKHSWVWVLHWPHVPAEISPTLEADRLAQMLAAAPHLSDETGRLVEEALWPALAHDDLPAFSQALMRFMALNRQALAAAGTPPASLAGTEVVLACLRENGALGWGEPATGLARFGLIRGGPDSIVLRRKLAELVGYEGGTVMATICDNRGGWHKFVAEGE